MSNVTKDTFLEKDIDFINCLGGVVKVAQICGITKGAVSQWKKNGIPKAHFNFLKLRNHLDYQRIYEIGHRPNQQ